MQLLKLQELQHSMTLRKENFLFLLDAKGTWTMSHVNVSANVAVNCTFVNRFLTLIHVK